MSDGARARTEVESYRQALLVALRLRDVPGDRIADALAEVDSHVAETGEAPEEAFGPPKQYAAALADALDPDRPRGWRAALAAVRSRTVPAAAVGGYLLADGVFALGIGEGATFGVPAWVALALGALLVCFVAVHVRTREVDRVIDPRTGEEVTFGAGPRLGAALAYGLPVAALALLYVAGTLLS
jgi:hypothetical protein